MTVFLANEREIVRYVAALVPTICVNLIDKTIKATQFSEAEVKHFNITTLIELVECIQGIIVGDWENE